MLIETLETKGDMGAITYVLNGTSEELCECYCSCCCVIVRCVL